MYGKVRWQVLIGGCLLSLSVFAGIWALLRAFTGLGASDVEFWASAMLTVVLAGMAAWIALWSTSPPPEPNRPEVPIVTGTPVRVGQIPPVAVHPQRRSTTDQLALTLAGGFPGPQVLTGLGGVGKTQLAVTLVDHALRTGMVDVVVWVSAAGPDAVVSGYAQAGIDLLGADPADQLAAAKRFLAWLARTRQSWLIVLDDLAKPADLNGWWPPKRPAGRVLVTVPPTVNGSLTPGSLTPGSVAPGCVAPGPVVVEDWSIFSPSSRFCLRPTIARWRRRSPCPSTPRTAWLRSGWPARCSY
jgi:hypothetical protein